MLSHLLQIDALHPEVELLKEAARILQQGKLVAFPTETVYGLGANALDENAVARIFEAKGRPTNNPVIVHVAEVAEAQRLVADWPETAARLTERFWPGPLTLVLPRRHRELLSVPDIVTAGGPTIAIRSPAHPVALELIRMAGFPIAAPSANRSSEISPTTAQHVLTSLGEGVDLILDGGSTPGGIESTVLDLTSDPPRLLRPGLITPGEIESTIGPIAISGNVGHDSEQHLPSPGMLSRHYAPRATLVIAEDPPVLVEQLLSQGKRVGVLDFLGMEARSGVKHICLSTHAKECAAQLYAALHQLDADAMDAIVVRYPPRGEEWDAIRDRLQRASCPAEEK